MMQKSEVPSECRPDSDPVKHMFPRPVVIDSDLRILDIPLVDLKLERPIICTCIRPGEKHGRWEKTSAKLESVGGVLVLCARGDDGKCDMVDSFRVLKKDFDIRSILIEGGASIIQSALRHRLAKQVVLTLRPCFFGGYRSMTDQLSTPLALQSITVASVEGDIVIHGILTSSERGESTNGRTKNAHREMLFPSTEHTRARVSLLPF